MEEKAILDLVLSVKEGDEVAFEQLLALYKPLIDKEIRRYRKIRIIPEEMYSEVSMVFHKAALSYDPQSFTTFGLYAKICIGRKFNDNAKKHNKKSRIIRPSAVDVDKLGGTASIARRLADMEFFRTRMNKAKELLSDFEYRIFCLHIQGHKTAKIAEMLSVSSKSVDNAKNRAFTKLRRYYKEHPDE